MKKIALVGCGRISKRHIEAIAANEGVELALACDIQEARAKRVGEELDIPYLTDMREIRGVDVVAIATPSGLHPAHVKLVSECCDAPYIVCEKPVSLTVRETVEMYRVIEQTGKTLLPVFQNRYNPLVAFTKKLIDENSLGRIHLFNVNIFWNRNDEYFRIDWHGTMDRDGGILYTQASHYVDMLLFFFGRIKEGKGFGGRLRGLEVQDSVSAVCEFENGTVGSLNATISTYRRNYLTELTLIGEKGTLRLSGTNLNTIDFWDVEDMEKPDMDFKLDHIYGKGHDKMYEYITKEQFEHFPSYEEVLSGIALMEKLTY